MNLIYWALEHWWQILVVYLILMLLAGWGFGTLCQINAKIDAQIDKTMREEHERLQKRSENKHK